MNFMNSLDINLQEAMQVQNSFIRLLHMYFTFMLPCNVMDFFLNNQTDALIIQIYSVIKRVSGIFSAHHQEFSSVHSALVSFMQVSDDCFQAESEQNILTLLGSGHQTCMKLTSAEYTEENFTFMLPFIVIGSFLNNQPDAIIIQIYSVIKLYMFRTSSLPIIRSFLLYIRHW